MSLGVVVSFQILFLYSHMPLVKILKFNWDINQQLFNFIALFYDSLTYKLLSTQIYFLQTFQRNLNSMPKKKK